MSAKNFTERQGQYLAFIDAYTRVNGRPPAETDMQRHFRVSPPSVHQMVLTLERAGLIRRQPGVARSIQVLLAPEDLPSYAIPNPSNPLCRGTSGPSAVGSGILMLQLHGFDEAVGACMPQSRRADGFDRHRIGAAAAGVCRSTQTGLAAHSSVAPSAQTSIRSPRGCADAARRVRGA